MSTRKLKSLVRFVESELSSGRSNAILSPNTEDFRNTDRAFIDSGWRYVTIGKGEFLIKGVWVVFTRGDCGPSVIVQWGFLGKDDVVVEREDQRSLF